MIMAVHGRAVTAFIKTKRDKIKFYIGTLLIIISMVYGCGFNSWAAQATSGTWNGVTWSYNTGNRTLTVKSNGSIPWASAKYNYRDEWVSDYPWSYWVLGRAYHIEVDVEGTIPENAFYGCRTIDTITLGPRVTGIGTNAFNGYGGSKQHKYMTITIMHNGPVSMAKGCLGRDNYKYNVTVKYFKANTTLENNKYDPTYMLHATGGIGLNHDGQVRFLQNYNTYQYLDSSHTHSWGGWQTTKDATCTVAGTKMRTCTTCAATETQSLAALGHSYGSAWSTNANAHWHICTRYGCTSKSEEASHTWPSSWSSDGSVHYKDCTVCGRRLQTGNHNWPSDWNASDGSNHYKKCTTCGRVSQTAAHSWTWKSTVSNHWQECCCGKTQNTAAHVDNNHDGICDTCKRDISAPIIRNSTYVVDQNGIDVYVKAEETPSSGASGMDRVNIWLWNSNLGDYTKGKNFNATAGNWMIKGVTYNYYYRVNKADFSNHTTGYYSDARAYDKNSNHSNVWDGTGSCRRTLDNVSLTTDLVFYDNGGTGGPGSVTWVIGSIQAPQTPVRDHYIFTGWNSAQDGSGTWWPTDGVVTESMSEFYAQWIPAAYYISYHPNNGNAGTMKETSSAELQAGSELHKAFETLAGDIKKIRYIRTATEKPTYNSKKISKDDSGEVYAAFAGDTILIYAENEKVFLNTDSNGIFEGFVNLQDIGPVKTWVADQVEDLSSLFKGCESLPEIDLRGWNTPKLKKAREIFSGCRSVRKIFVSEDWSIAQIGEYADGSGAFTGCESLTGFDPNRTDITLAVTDQGYLTPGDNIYQKHMLQIVSMHPDATDRMKKNIYTKTGYVFEGWSETKNGQASYADEAPATDLTNTADQAVELYAVWDNGSYTIGFNKNDELAAGTMEDQIFRYDVAQKLHANAFTKKGYHFVHWEDRNDGTGKSYEDQANILNLTGENGARLEFFAKWQANPYTVHYDKNSGKASGYMPDQSFVYDSPQALSNNAFTRPGYHFESWIDDRVLQGENPTGPSYEINGTTYVSDGRYDQGETVANLTDEKDGTVVLYADWRPNTYTVHFDKNIPGETPDTPEESCCGAHDDPLMPKVEYIYDEANELPENKFTRIGYAFTGWNTEADGAGTAIAPGQRVSNLAESGCVTLYAQWSSHTYIIQFSGNGHTSGFMHDQLVRYDQKVTLSQNQFEKTGYTFTEWTSVINSTQRTFVDQELIENLASDQASIITMKASWRANQYTIHYDRNADSAAGTMSEQIVTVDAPEELLDVGFTRTGYTFGGWNTKADGSGVAYENKATVMNLAFEDRTTVTLYAQWTPITYTIAFDGVNGVGSMDSIQMVYDVAQRLPANTFNVEGYPFRGWNTAKDGTGVGYADEASVNNLTAEDGGTVTLYAQYGAAVYTVKYHANDPDAEGEMPDQVFTYDVAGPLIGNQYHKTGYTFTGWNSRPDGSGVSYADGETVCNLVDTTGEIYDLYAQWSPNTYRISFDKNSMAATGAMISQIYVYGAYQPIHENTFLRPGYTFTGWNTRADGSGDSFRNKENVRNLVTSPGGELLLYAQWQPNAYTVEFLPNAEDAKGETRAQAFDYNESQPLRENGFTRTGYTFAYWSTQADGSGDHYQDQETVSNLTTAFQGIVKLYANWSPITYTVRFVPNTDQVEGAMDSITVGYGEKKELPEVGFTKDGYLFDGWNTKPDGTGIGYYDKQSIQNLSDKEGAVVTLYGQWMAGAHYVTFDGNGSDSGEMGNQALVAGVEMRLNENRYAKTGYHFKYWTTSADGTGIIYEDQAVVVNLTEHGDVRLYAQWETNRYQISYQKNSAAAAGSMNMDTFTYGIEGILSANGFTRTGFTFTGWNTAADGSGDAYKDQQTVLNLTGKQDEVIYLYAQWEENSYQIVFDKNHSQATGMMATMDVAYSSRVTIPECGFNRAGYHLGSWNTKADGSGERYNVGQKVSSLVAEKDGRITLYVQWQPNAYTVHFDSNCDNAAGVMGDEEFTYDEEKELSANGFGRAGYLFNSWNTKKDGTGDEYTDGALVKNLVTAQNGSITLYAQWQSAHYQVYFHGNGSDVDDVMMPQDLYFDVSASLFGNEFEKSGYMFVGWNTAADGSGDTYADRAEVVNLADAEGAVVDLYAMWGTIRYHVAFDANHESATGAMNPVTYGYDQTQRLPANTFIRTRYTFAGWNTVPDGSGAGYADRAQVLNLTNVADETVTLYAQWRANSYVVIFDKNSELAAGTMENQTLTCDTPEKLRKNAYSRVGYVFDGWSLRADGKGVIYRDEQEVSNLAVRDGAEVSLYAQWKPVRYVVRYDKGAYNVTGQMADQNMSYDKKEKLLSSKYERNGFEFKSWNTASDGSGTSYLPGDEVVNLADTENAVVTLYAVWGSYEYHIRFHGNGATAGTMGDLVVSKGERADLPRNTFTNTGYRFADWNTEADGSGQIYSDGASVVGGEPADQKILDLYAQWESTPYTVHYDLNGGEWADGFTPPTQKYADEVLRLPGSSDLQRDGFIFLGWYTNSACVGNAITELYQENTDITLYARWYDMTVRNNGISPPVKHDFKVGN